MSAHVYYYRENEQFNGSMDEWAAKRYKEIHAIFPNQKLIIMERFINQGTTRYNILVIDPPSIMFTGPNP
jgi:hypothetical protein